MSPEGMANEAIRALVPSRVLASSMWAVTHLAQDAMAAKAAWDGPPATRPLRLRRATRMAPALPSSHWPESSPSPPRPPVMAAVLVRLLTPSPAVWHRAQGTGACGLLQLLSAYAAPD